jgi:hypothetical protein
MIETSGDGRHPIARWQVASNRIGRMHTLLSRAHCLGGTTTPSASGAARYLQKLRHGVRTMVDYQTVRRRLAADDEEAEQRARVARSHSDAGLVVTEVSHIDQLSQTALWAQGDESLETKESIQRRLALRRAPVVVDALRMAWDVAARGGAHANSSSRPATLEFEEYAALMRRICA